METLLLLIGFAMLVLSGRWLVLAAVFIARRLHLPSLLIGLTVVAIGTSAPELLVSVTAALKGFSDVAIYNVVGSNISNVMLVLALAVLILPVAVKKGSLWKDWIVMFLFTLLLWLFFRDLKMGLPEGLLIFLLLAGYVVLSFLRAGKNVSPQENSDEMQLGLGWALLLVVLASGGLALGADLLVDSAVQIAQDFGLSERIISVSLVAVGTSIPELTTSIIAAFRKQTDISIGNIIGSNIFNIGFVLGITSMVKPIHATPLFLSFDILWLLGVCLLLLALILSRPSWSLTRWNGGLMFAIYFLYLYLVLG